MPNVPARSFLNALALTQDDGSFTHPKTSVTFLLDKSGSMSSIHDATIIAFNSYLDELRASENIVCALYQFDTSTRDFLEMTYERQAVKTAPPLSRENFLPCGGTPLYYSIREVIARIEKTASPGDRNVLVILTDGEDTTGDQYAPGLAKDLIAIKRRQGWQILFLGAGINIDKMALKLGVSPKQSLSYNARNASKETLTAMAKQITAYADSEPREEHDIDIKQLGKGGTR